MKFKYLSIWLILFVAVLLSGCIEVGEEEEVTTTTILTTTTTTSALVITTTSTTFVTTSTTLAKKVQSCNYYCKGEGYEGGKCRKTAAQCRIYGINEIYKPLGNKYCPRGTGYDACCCSYKVTTTTTTVRSPEGTTTTTTLAVKKEAEVSGFEYLKPLAFGVKYESNGLFSCEILNGAGVEVEIVNLSSDECSGLGIGSLDQIKLEADGGTMIRAWCEEKNEGEEFRLSLNFVYKEVIPSGVEVYQEDGGVIWGEVENEDLPQL